MSSNASPPPPGWVRVPLGEIGRWIGGGTPSKSEARFWTSGTIPWISPKDMKSAVLHDAEDHITPVALDASATQLVPPCSVLVVMRSGILRHSLPVAVNAVPVALNQDLKAITPYMGIDATYLAWALRRFADEILHECTKAGTTVQSVETPKLQRFSIPLPSLVEQRRIVTALEEHLSDLDAAVSGLERARANISRYRTAVISSAVLSRCEGVTGEISQIELPERWAWVELRSLGTIKGGLTKGQRRRPGDVVRPVPYLRVANVQRGYLDLSDMREIEATEEEIGELRLEPGDVLFNEGGDRDKLGRGWVWQGELPKCIHQNHVFRARLDRTRAHPKLVSFYANTWGQKFFLEQGRQTTNLASINLSKLGSLPIPLPPREEQNAIVDEIERRLAVADHTAVEIDAQLARAARLRQSILKRAFEGKLVPQNPTDEPASVLLERIRAERAAANNGARSAPRRRTVRT